MAQLREDRVRRIIAPTLVGGRASHDVLDDDFAYVVGLGSFASSEGSGSSPTPAFPEDSYEHMTPAVRMAAVIRLSRRLFAMKPFSTDGERRHPGLPDRLVGGRR